MGKRELSFLCLQLTEEITPYLKSAQNNNYAANVQIGKRPERQCLYACLVILQVLFLFFALLDYGLFGSNFETKCLKKNI